MNKKRVIRRIIKVRRKPRGRSIYSSTVRIRRVSNSTIARDVIIRTIEEFKTFNSFKEQSLTLSIYLIN
jgi:hypothetical protein